MTPKNSNLVKEGDWSDGGYVDFKTPEDAQKYVRLLVSEKQKSFEEGKSLMVEECNKLVDRNKDDRTGLYDYDGIAEDLIKYLKKK